MAHTMISFQVSEDVCCYGTRLSAPLEARLDLNKYTEYDIARRQ